MTTQRMTGLILVSLDAVEGLRYLMFGGKGGGARKAISKLTCNGGRCHGADPCGGGADPMLDIYVTNDQGEHIPAFLTNRLASNVSNSKQTRLQETIPLLLDTDLAKKSEGTNKLKIVILDHDKGSIDNDTIGYVEIDLSTIFNQAGTNGEVFKNKWFELIKDPLNPSNSPGNVMLTIEYFDYAQARKDPIYQGMGLSANHFPVTEGNEITLYHDASRMDPDGQGWDQCLNHYDDHSAWSDLYKDLLEAKHMIAIMGWAVDMTIPLKRSWNDINEHGETLGELLARKQKTEGCEVYVIVWDDPSSLKSDGMLGGMMGTHDEATRLFCEEHKINFDKHKRITYYEGYSVLSATLDMHLTHHQKMVVFDAPQVISENAEPFKKRVLKAYFGGLDLTNGRFDTPEHHLFQYNDTVFRPKDNNGQKFNDFHNGCIRKNDDHGPRQPWHDIHAKVQGPLAWDFLVNFLERVNVQSNRSAIYKNESNGQRVTLYKKFKQNLDRILEGEQLIGYTYRNLKGKDNLFCAQMYRSICFKSAFHSRSPSERYSGYRYKFPSNKIIDHSIQNAYLHQISKAQRFIYFENQYWNGSDYAWLECKKSGSPHRIPDSVVRTVCERMSEGRDFHVYINIPLFPEGIPSDQATQEILYWQYQTFRMMIYKVAMHCESLGRPLTDWRKYLSIYYMGKREPLGSSREDMSAAATNRDTAVLRSVKKHRRHPIYIHSKFFVVDDEFALLGSANVNERSMCGIKDTEIASGMWQPNFIAKTVGKTVSLPNGYVAQMRRHLWQELVGDLDPRLADPGSPECIELVRSRATTNREAYWEDNRIDHLPHGFLCEYPYVWDSESRDIKPFGNGKFPDFDAPIFGKPTWVPGSQRVTG